MLIFFQVQASLFSVFHWLTRNLVSLSAAEENFKRIVLCTFQTYKYLVDKGYPFPSFKTMRRYISIVEEEVKKAENGNSVFCMQTLYTQVFLRYSALFAGQIRQSFDKLRAFGEEIDVRFAQNLLTIVHDRWKL